MKELLAELEKAVSLLNGTYQFLGAIDTTQLSGIEILVKRIRHLVHMQSPR